MRVLSARIFSLSAYLLSLACYVFGANVTSSTDSSLTSSTTQIDNLDSQTGFADVEDWARLAREAGAAGQEVTEVIVSSQPVEIKRSDSDPEGTQPPKKKPVMYSWWMPNMVNGGQTASPTTATTPVPEDEEQTTKQPGTKRPRVTRKPRVTLRPRTRKPGSSSVASTSPPEEHTISPTIKTTPSSTAFTTHSATKSKTTSTSTTPSPEPTQQSTFNRALEIKAKLLNIAKVVGGVALIAKGTAGQIALSTTGVDPYVKVAGHVGSLAATTAVQVAPVAKNVAVQAGSLAASALYKAGTLAVSGAGRAFEAINNRIASQRALAEEKADCENMKAKKSEKSENEVMVRDIPIITMTTREITNKTSPRPRQRVGKRHKSKSPVDEDNEGHVEIVMTKENSVSGKDPLSEPDPESTEPASSEMVETRDVPKTHMSTGNGHKGSRNNGQKSLSALGKAGDMLVICSALGVQLIVKRLMH